MALGCVVLLPGCGLYDLIWGREESQKRVAAQRAPAPLQREENAKGPAGAVRTLRVRVR